MPKPLRSLFLISALGLHSLVGSLRPSSRAPGADMSPTLGSNARREFFVGGGLLCWGIMAPKAASARGLVRFPPETVLSNRYFLVRAGESTADSMNVVRSNPVDKLSVENGLTAKGIAEADAAAVTLQDFGLECPQMWYSTWAKASQTASIIGERLQMGFERRLPEYTYLDMRGCGEFEGTSLDEAASTLGRLDEMGYRESPPPTEDGTPNESVESLAARVQQMLSIIETLATGSDVVVVASDSDLLSVWQACVTGAPLAGHGAFAMRSGEVRPLEYKIQYTDPSGAPPPVVLAPMRALPAEAAASAKEAKGAKGAKGALSAKEAKEGKEAAHVESRLALLDARYKDAEKRQARGEAAAAKLGAAGRDAEQSALVASLRAEKRGRDGKERREYNEERADEAEELKQRQQKGDEARRRQEEETARAKAAAQAAKGAYQDKTLLANPGEWLRLAAEYPVAAVVALGGLATVASQARITSEQAGARDAANILANYSSNLANSSEAEPKLPLVESADTLAFAAAVEATRTRDALERRNVGMSLEDLAAGLLQETQPQKAESGSSLASSSTPSPKLKEKNENPEATVAGGAGSTIRSRPRQLSNKGDPQSFAVPVLPTPDTRERAGVDSASVTTPSPPVSPVPLVEVPGRTPAPMARASVLPPPAQPTPPQVSTPSTNRVDFRSLVEGENDSPQTPVASPWYYEVVFPDSRLGIGLEAGDDESKGNVASASDAVFPYVVQPSSGPLNPTAVIGDMLVSVNGVRLDVPSAVASSLGSGNGFHEEEARDLFDCALALVKAAGRPVILGFRPTQGDRIPVDTSSSQTPP
mmetsp:Transcript_33529/g.66754  ORF Transcript_33529/g.66754 Transcript_33529/m.66754 type:complete len:821 (+) Transcript_33529:59-2521(+)